VVSAAWVAGRLSPYGRWVKTAAIAAAAAGMVSTGALVEHWRMGRKLAQQAEANTQQRLREVTQLTAEQQDREAKNAAAILAAHSALKAQRAINATLAAQLAGAQGSHSPGAQGSRIRLPPATAAGGILGGIPQMNNAFPRALLEPPHRAPVAVRPICS
jgi:hypothetical protein